MDNYINLDANEARQITQKEIASFFARVQMRKARQALEGGGFSTEEEILYMTMNSIPSKWQIKAPAGIGKTTAVINEIRKLKLGLKILYYLPTHDMMIELHENMQDAGINSVMITGRSEANCQNIILAKKVASYGVSVSGHLCKKCQYNSTCEYYSQREEKPEEEKVVVYILPHSYLSKNTGLGKPDVVIVDESHWQAHYQKQELDLRLVLGNQSDLINSHHDSIIKVVCEALLNNSNDALSSIRSYGKERVCNTIKACSVELNKTIEKITDDLKLGIDESQILQRLSHDKLKLLAAVHNLLIAVANEISAERGAFNSIVMEGNKAVIYLLNPLQINTLLCDVLLIDASADEEINAKIWGDFDTSINIEAKRNARIYQAYRRGCSKNSLLGDYDKDRSTHNRQELVEFLSRLKGKVFVASTKAVRELLEPRFDSDKYKFGHFSKLRGSNKFQDCNSVVVIGREQPPASSLTAYARAFYSDDSKFIKEQEYRFSGTFLKAPFRQQFVNFYTHADYRVCKFLHQIREREIEQALDRVRLMSYGRMKDVYILTNLKLQLEVDIPISWNELLSGLKIEKAILECKKLALAFPLGSSELSNLFPDLWPTPDHAKKYLQFHGGDKWVESQVIYYMENAPFRIYEYRKEAHRGTGKPSRALISDVERNPKAALEKVLRAKVSVFAKKEDADRLKEDLTKLTLQDLKL